MIPCKNKFFIIVACVMLCLQVWAKQSLMVGWYPLSKPSHYHYSRIMVQDVQRFVSVPEAADRKELLAAFLSQGDTPVIWLAEFDRAWNNLILYPEVARYMPHLVALKNEVMRLQDLVAVLGKRDVVGMRESIKKATDVSSELIRMMSLDEQMQDEHKAQWELRKALEYYRALVVTYVEVVQDALAKPAGITLPKHVSEYVVKKTEYFTNWSLVMIADAFGDLIRAKQPINAAKVDEIVAVARESIKLSIKQAQEYGAQDDTYAQQLLQKITDLHQVRQNGTADSVLDASKIKDELRAFAVWVKSALPVAYTQAHADELEGAIAVWDESKIVSNIQAFRAALAQDMAAQQQWLDLLH